MLLGIIYSNLAMINIEKYYIECFLIILVIIRFIYYFKKKQYSIIYEKNKNLIYCLVFGAIISLNYLTPFWTNYTSGLYANSGGDHSTYLAQSEYFKDNNLYKPVIDKKETIPPQPFWETKRYPHWTLKNLNTYDLKMQNKQGVYDDCNPIGNQMFASGFMKFLPGENDETYTAIVAYFLSLAGLSMVSLITFCAKINNSNFWVCFIPICFTNMLMFPAGTQSIPFIFIIIMINILALTVLIILRSNEKSSFHFSSFVPPAICASGLFIYYPYLFLFQFVCFL